MSIHYYWANGYRPEARGTLANIYWPIQLVHDGRLLSVVGVCAIQNWQPSNGRLLAAE